MDLPNIVKVRRNFEDNAIQDIEGCVDQLLEFLVPALQAVRPRGHQGTLAGTASKRCFCLHAPETPGGEETA